MISVAFVSAVIRKEAVWKAVRVAVLDDAVTALSVVGTGFFGTHTFFYVCAGHVVGTSRIWIWNTI